MNRFIKKDELDNVATAMCNSSKNIKAHVFSYYGTLLEEVVSNEMIPYGNKIALFNIKVGEKIIKCNEIIGLCTEDINKGDLVHVHNVKSLSVDIPKEFKIEIMKQIKAIQAGDNNEI